MPISLVGKNPRLDTIEDLQRFLRNPAKGQTHLSYIGLGIGVTTIGGAVSGCLWTQGSKIQAVGVIALSIFIGYSAASKAEDVLWGLEDFE